MELATLDLIVRRTLLEKGLPIHYYLEMLLHQSSAIRELSKHSLQIVNTVNLSLNDYNAIDLPSDFVDDVGVYIPVGNLLQQIPKKSSITPLRLNDTTTGAFVPYSDIEDESNVDTINTGWFWFWNVNEWGEPTGRFYGAHGGAKLNGYRVLRERRQIQFTETFRSENAVLIYISNGQNIDNATQIDWRAFSTIQAYSDWKSSPNAAMKDSYEAATFYNELRLLRASMSDLTVTDIVDIIRRNYYAAMKN